MKYYLGYYNNQRYIPIKSETIGDSILSIVDYTTNFPTIKAIKESLYKEGLIPNPQVHIDYIIEKGNKDNRNYQRINVTDQIYTSESKDFFDITSIKKYLNDESNNLDFLSFLSAKYLKKYGYTKRIANYLYNADEAKVEEIFKGLLKIASNPNIISIITNTLDYLERNKGRVNREILEGHIDSFNKTFISNQSDVTNFFVYLKKYIKFRQIPAMNYLHKLFQLAINTNRTGKEHVIDSPDEYINKSTTITNFFNEIIYYYDYKRYEFKTENGKKKINSRELFDLGVFIADYFKLIYEDYLSEIKMEYENSEEYYIDDDDKEEFLTDEDFARVGATAEEMGYRVLG